MVEMIQRRAARSVLNRFDRKDGETEMLSTLERKTLKSRQTIARLRVNPLLSPPGGLLFLSTFFLRGGGCLKESGGLFNLAKRITCSKNTVV